MLLTFPEFYSYIILPIYIPFLWSLLIFMYFAIGSEIPPNPMTIDTNLHGYDKILVD